MKKVAIYLAAVLFFNFFLSRTLFADEISDLKEQLNAMQGEMRKQARIMEEMQRKIEILEGEKDIRATGKTGCALKRLIRTLR